MKMKIAMCLVLGGVVAGQVLADAQTWMGNPASAVWNMTDLNWDDGAVWAGDSAVFGESEVKNVIVEGDVAVSNITFSADGYVLEGNENGKLMLVGSEPIRWTVAEDCTAAIRTAVTNVTSVSHDTTLVKEGKGELQLSGRVRVLRFHGNEGRLNLKDCDLTIALLRASYATSTCVPVFDQTTIHAISSGSKILIGDTQRFPRAELGAGGLKIIVPEGSTSYSTAQNFTTAEDVEHDGGLTIDTQGVFVLQGDNSFNGGVTLDHGQLRVTRSEALGTGSLRLKPSTTFFTTSGEIEIPNKVIAGDGSYVGSTGAETENIILRNIGVSAGDNTAGKFGIGRASGYSRAQLSLTHPDSEAIGTFLLRGDLDLTIDGGVIRAREDSPSPFFSTKNYVSERPACAKVGSGGFTFDTNGAETELGIALDFSQALKTNVEECVTAFSNPSFEEGLEGGNPTGWQVTHNVNNEAVGGRNQNSSGYTEDDPAYQTTNGNWYVVVRRVGTLSTTFTLPEAGDWRVVFDMGDRAGNYLSSNITVTVTVDDLEPFIIGPRPAGPFRRFDTPFWNLPAGTHNLVIATHDGSGRTHDSVLFDMFRLERITSIHPPKFEKLGEGTLTHTGLTTEGPVSVQGGTLNLMEASLKDTNLAVANDSTLRLYEANLENVTATVEAGATLSFERETVANYIVNGDFEENVLEEAQMPTSNPTGWTLTDSSPIGEKSGYQINGSSISTYEDANKDKLPGPYTSSGVQTLYLRRSATATQTLTIPEAGVYRLSYQVASRQYRPSWELGLDVLIDDEVVESVLGRDAFYSFEPHEVLVPLTAGTHTLSFQTSAHSAQYVILLLDDVKLQRVYEMPTVTSGVLNFASGAVLNLAFDGTLELADATVDGKTVRGNATALRAAGVNVTGVGKVQIGPPGGTLFLLR